jgi:ribosomal protein S18 acetylase RimI-like enzyme
VIRPAREEDAAAMGRLHATEIDEGFLPTLGARFLTRLYRRIVRSPASFAFVADDGSALVGFVAGTENLRGLYREFAMRDGAVAGFNAAPRLVRSWRRVLETLRYPMSSPTSSPTSGGRELPDAELIAIAVARDARGRGVGRALVGATTAEFARRGVDRARVVAAADNRAAIALYRACGFEPAATVHVHRGTPSEVLTWS